ncbi:MAG: GuaB3 family IMP dehydrogenase-related protein [Actinomycetia bacterium]|nr:GuaB3 family IMP dehydrogenase-related protein [Actinomycetes bacterium]
MPETVEIGLGRSVRRGYHLDQIAVVPTRRTRAQSLVSTQWQIDAHAFELPLVAAPSDAVVSPVSATVIEGLGGLAVLDGEGLWARHADADAVLARLTRDCGGGCDGDDGGCDCDVDDVAELQAAYAAPIQPDLLRRRIGELRAAGVRVAVRLAPQHTVELAPHVLAAGVDVLVIQGQVISAEHVAAKNAEQTALNLKTFIADIDVPVIVGGCANYQTALHLMRTGAAGVIVGYGSHLGSTTQSVLGMDVPMATAIIDAAAARREHLDETGGRYVHLIAYGDTPTGGGIAKALACGADAVMLGEALAGAAEAPGGGRFWDSTAGHPRLPRSMVLPADGAGRPSLAEVVAGPTSDPSGRRNLFGALRRVMAKCGYSTVKEFQKAELILCGLD